MNYLLIEITVCLLGAGLIGMVIGWLLRGGCKEKLLAKAKEGEERLKSNESIWKKQVQTLISEKEEERHRMKKELQEHRDRVHELEERNHELERKNREFTHERKELVTEIYEKKFEEDMYALERRVEELSQQLSEERNSLKIKESDLKEHIALNKTLRAREVAWKSKVQGLMTENKQSKERLEDALGKVQSKLSLLEEELKRCQENRD